MSLIRFGEFEVDEQTFELRRSGSLIRLQQQPARILAFLLIRRGTLVTRKQIQDAIWGQETFVDFGWPTVSYPLSKPRKAIAQTRKSFYESGAFCLIAEE